jgi:hypothetical protein
MPWGDSWAAIGATTSSRPHVQATPAQLAAMSGARTGAARTAQSRPADTDRSARALAASHARGAALTCVCAFLRSEQIWCPAGIHLEIRAAGRAQGVNDAFFGGLSSSPLIRSTWESTGLR